jgi:hypothetical protein
MATLYKGDSQMADRSQNPLIGPRQAAITAAVAITGTEDPTEAEYNLLVTAINAIITVLEAHGLVASND